jgi:hypothetical protein
MGRRSRNRTARPTPGEQPPSGRGERLRRRAEGASKAAEQRIRERPPAPWDPFPLTELAILAGLLLLVAGALVGGPTGTGLIAAGVVLACIGGLETALREHLGGYRSHAGLLAGGVGVAVLVGASALLDLPAPVAAAIAIAAFGILFTALRSSFVRRSGGRGVL